MCLDCLAKLHDSNINCLVRDGIVVVVVVDSGQVRGSLSLDASVSECICSPSDNFFFGCDICNSLLGDMLELGGFVKLSRNLTIQNCDWGLSNSRDITSK